MVSYSCMATYTLKGGEEGEAGCDRGAGGAGEEREVGEDIEAEGGDRRQETVYSIQRQRRGGSQVHLQARAYVCQRDHQRRCLKGEGYRYIEREGLIGL
jgi:hypothetical protein